MDRACSWWCELRLMLFAMSRSSRFLGEGPLNSNFLVRGCPLNLIEPYQYKKLAKVYSLAALWFSLKKGWSRDFHFLVIVMWLIWLSVFSREAQLVLLNMYRNIAAPMTILVRLKHRNLQRSPMMIFAGSHKQWILMLYLYISLLRMALPLSYRDWMF